MSIALEVASQLISNPSSLLPFDNDDPAILEDLTRTLGLSNVENIQDLVTEFNQKYQNDPDECLALFTRLGSIEWVRYFLGKEITNCSFPIHYAAISGQMEMLKLLLDHADNKYGKRRSRGHLVTFEDHVMCSAASGGHVEIVQLMLDRGARKYNLAMNTAAREGHTAIVQLMLNRGGNDYNESMENAARNGHIEIVRLMLKRGATNHNLALRVAATNGHTKIVELLLNHMANNYGEAIGCATSNGYIDIVHLIQEWRDIHK